MPRIPTLSALLALLGCGAPAPSSLPVVHLEAVASATCDAGPSELPATAIEEPHCGFDTSSLAVDAGPIHVDTGAPAHKLTGILELTELEARLDGGLAPTSTRRQLMAGTTRVYPAFGSGAPLYDVDATGALTLLGDAGVLDAGVAVFAYPQDLSEGGVVITEVHRVLLVELRPVTVSDHSQDPFYGCCAQVGGETLTPLFALAALGFRRRRQRAEVGSEIVRQA